MDGPFSGERRQLQRRPGDTIGPLLVDVTSGDRSFAASAFDISVQGIGLLADVRFEPGTRVTIRPAREALAAFAVAGEIRHSQSRPEGKWLIGCRLTRNLTMDDILALG